MRRYMYWSGLIPLPSLAGRYVTPEIDLTETTADGTHEYTIMPTLIGAVGRRATDDDNRYVHRPA